MPRPQKFNADYFSHDAGMRNDDKVKALRRKFKTEGYAVWNMLLEYLTGKDYFRFGMDEITLELIAGDFEIEPERLKEVINYCVRIDLLQESGGVISSETHINRFTELLSKRKPSDSGVSDTGNTHSKVKESKGKERKVEKSKEQEIARVEEPLILTEVFKKEKKEAAPDIDARLDMALDERNIEEIRMNARIAYPGVDIDKEIARFRLKVKTSPRVYTGHDTGALLQALNFQLRGAMPEKPQGGKNGGIRKVELV